MAGKHTVHVFMLNVLHAKLCTVVFTQHVSSMKKIITTCLMDKWTPPDLRIE